MRLLWYIGIFELFDMLPYAVAILLQKRVKSHQSELLTILFIKCNSSLRKEKYGDGLLSEEACNLPTSRSKAHPQKISQLRMNFHTSRKCCLTLWKCFHEILHSCQANQNPICHFLKNGGDRRRDKWVSFTKKILTWKLKKRKNEFLCPKLQKNVIPFDMTDSRNFSADETLSLLHFFPIKWRLIWWKRL